MKNFLFALMAFSSLSTAHANCLPSDISGWWVMYQTNITAQPQHTGRCEIKVADNATKTLSGACKLSNGYEMSVTGTASVNANCAAIMTLSFTGGTMDFDMQLAVDRQAFVGRWKNSFGDLGGTNGVKK
jgi:hypothetical protein